MWIGTALEVAHPKLQALAGCEALLERFGWADVECALVELRGRRLVMQ